MTRLIPATGCACTELSALADPRSLRSASGPHTAPAEGAITITVYGQPKPKGSMKHVGHGRMVEQLEGSKPWREAVKGAALDARICGFTGATPVRRPPLEGPVVVEIMVTVAKPKSAPKTRETWPITRSSGDSDKHARNVLDALTDAGVFGDDSQVVDVLCRKRYPGQHADTLDIPGAVIRVRTLGGTS